MENLYIVLGVAVAIWLLTSSKFRKTIGQDVTDSVTISSNSSSPLSYKSTNLGKSS